MEVCAKLWAAGIAAEFGYKATLNLKDQLGYADENGIPFVVLFGETELEQVRQMPTRPSYPFT
jgi:histidyl-tRNA synthetase